MYLFNKREVFNGWSFKDFCSVRDALDGADIGCRYKVENLTGHTRSLGVNMDYSKRYIIMSKRRILSRHNMC